MEKNWLSMSASDLGRGIAAGGIDPIALTKTYLNAIDAHKFTPRIYSTVTHERALAEAAEAAKRARNGSRLSLLDGVPISWKDLFDTKDITTEAGTDLLKGRVPNMDAIVLKNASDAGLVCLGKTHMSELAFSGLGVNPITQTPPNVNDHDAIPGGSSSGAATSVAFNLAAAGIGSDTGGSVRIPSAWNDLVGLKTTSGVLSLDGVVPLCIKFDTVGPLTRTVEDAAHLYFAMAGRPSIALRPKNLADTNLLVLANIVLDDLEAAPQAAFNANLMALRNAGATLSERAVPLLEQAFKLAVCLYTYEAYNQWKDMIEASPDTMYPPILARFRAGAEFSKEDYATAWDTLNKLRAEFSEQTAQFDAILMPSSPILPPNLERLSNDSEYYVRANMLALRNSRVGNLMGLCALNLPTSVASCGLTVTAPAFGEQDLLNLGAAIEKIIKKDP